MSSFTHGYKGCSPNTNTTKRKRGITERSSNITKPSGDPRRAVIEHSVDGLLVIDEEGIIRMANTAATSLFSARTQNLLGFQLGTPAIREPVEIILPSCNGNLIVEMRSKAIVWKGKTSSLASLQDITERKDAAGAMLRQAAELQRRNEKLVDFHRAPVGRELCMIDLKREVNELYPKSGEAPRHCVPGDESAAGIPSGKQK